MEVNGRIVKGIIFDLDGTVLDSCSVWSDVDKDFFSKRGMEIPSDYGEKIGHIGLDKAASYTIKRFNLKETKEEVLNEWRDSVIEYYKHINLKPGAKEFLDYLDSEHIPYVVATANNKEIYVPALTNTGILDRFTFILEVNNYPKGKDDPEIYFDAAKKLGIPYENILVIEDLATAIKCAHKAGFITVGMDEATCKNKDEVRNNCDKYIYDFRELIS